jgi:hypothetical protein
MCAVCAVCVVCDVVSTQNGSSTVVEDHKKNVTDEIGQHDACRDV